MQIKVKKLRPGARLPVLGSACAAGADLHACLDYDLATIACHQTVKIATGIAVEIPDGYFGAIFARSGLATKSGLRPANCVGVIDSDYRGEVLVALHNDTDQNQMITNGERIAQLVIMPVITAEYKEVSELSVTDRGDGGFGSSGEREVTKKKRQKLASGYGEW
jgi:dUTP pyrophosphatase